MGLGEITLARTQNSLVQRKPNLMLDLRWTTKSKLRETMRKNFSEKTVIRKENGNCFFPYLLKSHQLASSKCQWDIFHTGNKTEIEPSFDSRLQAAVHLLRNTWLYSETSGSFSDSDCYSTRHLDVTVVYVLKVSFLAQKSCDEFTLL